MQFGGLNRKKMHNKCEKNSVSGGLQGILGDLEMWQKNAEMAIFTIFVEKMLKRPFL